jgi:hypothetical protein
MPLERAPAVTDKNVVNDQDISGLPLVVIGAPVHHILDMKNVLFRDRGTIPVKAVHGEFLRFPAI